MASEGEFVIRIPASAVLARLENVENRLGNVEAGLGNVEGKVDQVIKSQTEDKQIRATVKVARIGRSGVVVQSIAYFCAAVAGAVIVRLAGG